VNLAESENLSGRRLLKSLFGEKGGAGSVLSFLFWPYVWENSKKLAFLGYHVAAMECL